MTDAEVLNTNVGDTIYRQDAIKAMQKLEAEDIDIYGVSIPEGFDGERAVEALRKLPPAQPTLYGYNIKHLELIARVLQKEKMPPERVAECITDIGRIAAIFTNEFEEALKKAVEQCKI